METLGNTKFAVGDRVIVAAQCALNNLVGRLGTVYDVIPGSTVWEYDLMIGVRLDNLVSHPDVPFFPYEILKIDEKEDYAQLRLV